MPNINSAIKRNRQSEKRRSANRSVKSRVQTARTKFFQAVEDGSDPGRAEKHFNAYCSVLDKAAKKGTIKPRSASRRKSRAARKLAAIQSGTD